MLRHSLRHFCDAEMLSDTDTLIESEMITLLISMLSREWIAGLLTCTTEFDALVDALSEALCACGSSLALLSKHSLMQMYLLILTC